MSAIQCKPIRDTLDDFIGRLGWDDYVFIFTKTKDWVEPDSVFVREATEEMIEATITQLTPWVIKLNAWARKEIHELTAYTALSARETECMLLVSEGKKSKQIADLLGISQRTVEFHIQNAMQKLGGASRSQAASRLVMATFPQLTNMTALAKSDSLLKSQPVTVETIDANPLQEP
jgi:DNA-binding CsgD family transcriptional regulator